ncbi:hypothetical protein GCM10027037_01760 [Mucilaginibacter koreensis]
MLFVAGFANAQKIGYVNTNELMQTMPEVKGIQTQINTFQKSYVDQLNSMQTEFQKKAEAYQKGQATMNDAAKTAAESELQDFQKRMQDFNNDASQKVQAKGQELMKPVADKVRGAITAVAKEKGYAYVLDESNVDLIVKPAADNMQPAVKAKLGIK